ncbi:MAG: excalibur calcium-binding domain-containing protein [Pseudanabaena sp. CRU_2_10]|nr:excalibur calcium-binding domain-containing protein [Pseudanabaena sp. CRU_2_10]
MKKFIIVLVLCFLGWQIYTKYQTSRPLTTSNREVPSLINRPSSQKESSPLFRCDGRTHCSQMTSCAEATFFLKNCPNVKMDGNNDGIPCEQQWCK